MTENLEEVRREIEDTRIAIGEKIGRLENKIETTATTTLNPAYYVRTRPWPTLGVFVAVGWLVGRALQPSDRNAKYSSGQSASAGNGIVRSFVSGAASMIGVAAGDWLRDMVRDRKTRRSP